MDNPLDHKAPKGYRSVVLDVFTNGHDVFLPPLSDQIRFKVPIGFELVQLVAYTSATEIVVPSQLGVTIDADDDNNSVHDCHLMGCSGLEHIVARFPVR